MNEWENDKLRALKRRYKKIRILFPYLLVNLFK